MPAASLLLVLTALFTAVVAAASLTWPFAWDPGIFSWVADTIRHGGLPYRDAWDAKGPLAYYLYAWLQRSGPAIVPVRIFDLLIVIAGALAVASIVRRFSGDGRAASWTALLLILAFYSTDFWNTAQPDTWVTALSAIAVALLVPQPTTFRIGLASLLLGIAVLQKPTFAIWLPLPLLALHVFAGTAARRAGVALMSVVLMLAPALLVGAWFQSKGAWPALLDGYLWLNLELSRTAVGGVPRAVAWLLTRVPPIVLPALPGAILGAAWLWRRERVSALVLLYWVASSWLLVAVQRRYFGYHWHPVFFSTAVIAGIGYAAALKWPDREVASPASRILARAAVFVMLVMLVMPLQVRVRDAISHLANHTDAMSYLAQLPRHESDIVASDLALASWLGQHSTPADKVVVWDSPLANALSGRKPPTRIGFFFPLVSPVITGSALEPGPLQQRMRAEYLGGLDDPATRYVAVTADALAGREPQPRKSIPMLFPEFGERLTRSWTVVDSAAGYLVFARQAQ
jgi:hypothetical protein